MRTPSPEICQLADKNRALMPPLALVRLLMSFTLVWRFSVPLNVRKLVTPAVPSGTPPVQLSAVLQLSLSPPPVQVRELMLANDKTGWNTSNSIAPSRSRSGPGVNKDLLDRFFVFIFILVFSGCGQEQHAVMTFRFRWNKAFGSKHDPAWRYKAAEAVASGKKQHLTARCDGSGRATPEEPS